MKPEKAKMSDQLFLGLSPKSPAGKEYLFFSLDDWIEIDRFIWSTVLGEYPDHPTWDAETAERLAEELQMQMDFGIAHAYFVYMLRTRSLQEVEENPGNGAKPELWPGEGAHEVRRMIDLLSGFILFLRECGGFKVDGC